MHIFFSRLISRRIAIPITAAFVFQPLHATDPGGVAILPRERHNSSWSKAAMRSPGRQGKFCTGEATRLQRRRATSVVPGKRRRYVLTLPSSSSHVLSACIAVLQNVLFPAHSPGKHRYGVSSLRQHFRVRFTCPFAGFKHVHTTVQR